MASFFYIIPIFVVFTLWLSFLSFMAPTISGPEEIALRFPTSFDDLFSLSKLFKAYLESNRTYMFCLFISAYLYKQAFCIPGSALLNILGGAIFGLWTALPLCCFLTGLGATLSYLLSKSFAEDLVLHFWSKEVDRIRTKIASHNDELLFFLLSLRLMPLTPNWLLNLISPIVGVPLPLFFITVFLGLIPYNYICIQAGAMLGSISSFDDVLTSKTMLQLSGLAFVVIIPGIVKRYVKLEK
uniref:VTT domain-containing protein n=1 Tax=Riptortus pedestris TaxID=329032 RepID=R4WDW1_RIPPE|nr:conserved hypothetical protein [Riptortus pedestris]